MRERCVRVCSACVVKGEKRASKGRVVGVVEAWGVCAVRVMDSRLEAEEGMWMMECPSAVMPVMCFFFRVITSPRPTNGKKVRCTAFFCVEPQQRRGGRRKTEATQGRPLASLMKNQDKQRASHVCGCVRTRSMSCAVRGARVRGEREARREHGSNAPQDDDDERRESVCVKEQHQRTSRFRFVCRCHLSVVAFSGFRPFFFHCSRGRRRRSIT